MLDVLTAISSSLLIATCHTLPLSSNPPSENSAAPDGLGGGINNDELNEDELDNEELGVADVMPDDPNELLNDLVLEDNDPESVLESDMLELDMIEEVLLKDTVADDSTPSSGPVAVIATSSTATKPSTAEAIVEFRFWRERILLLISMHISTGSSALELKIWVQEINE